MHFSRVHYKRVAVVVERTDFDGFHEITKNGGHYMKNIRISRQNVIRPLQKTIGKNIGNFLVVYPSLHKK